MKRREDEGDGTKEVELATFDFVHEAELARGFLEDAGILAGVLADPAGQIQFGRGFSSRPRLLVRREDVDAARTLLRELGSLGADPGASGSGAASSSSPGPGAGDEAGGPAAVSAPGLDESPFRPDLVEGRVALVTGGGTGIGREIARWLAAHGADLVLASRSREHLEPAADEMERWGQRVLVRPMDVRDPEEVNAVVREAAEELGGLHIVVNNAAGNFLTRAEELSVRGWQAVVEIVLDGTFFVSRAAFPHLRDAGGGAIVNISTTYVDSGAALMAHSGAAKAGVLNLTRSLAAEWGPYGIRVNAVAPGLVEGTEGARRLVESTGRMGEFEAAVPLGRLARPADVGRAVLFLASPAGAHISGAHLVVDGGESVGGKFANPDVSLRGSE